MFWLVQSRMAFGPTPTPTATRGAPLTSTPDFLATRVAEDFVTQQAHQMAVLGTTTPTPRNATPVVVLPDGTASSLPDNTPAATNTPVTVRLPGLNAPFSPTPTLPPTVGEEAIPDATPTGSVINLPIVIDSSPLATPTPAQVAEAPADSTATPATAETPAQETPIPTATPTETPTEIPTETPTPTPQPVDTATPTPTETLPPPSPTPTPIPPGQPLVVGSLQGFVGDGTATLRLGPSNLYTATNQIAPNTKLTILGRTNSGEWLYVCCVENQNLEPAWVRQAAVQPRDNPRQNGMSDDDDPNDVRWLDVQRAPTYLPVIPPLVPPGTNDYAFARADRHGAGRVDQLPQPPFNPTWSQEARAGGALVSAVAVGGDSVLVGSADNHLYAFERSSGSQRWRADLCQDGCRQVTQAPMIYERQVFIADQNRTVWAFEDYNNSNVLWRVSIPQPALSSFNIFSETLFLAIGEGANHALLALDIDNGAERWRQSTSGPGLKYPVIGDQLVYAADGVVAAYDVISGELVWQNPNVQNIIAGPVYGSPGPSSLAELYIVGSNNRIYALDANTGEELWNIDNGEVATSLALNDNLLFVAGDGYLKAISRFDQSQVWRTGIAGGQVMGGPLVDATHLMAVTQAGNVHLLDNTNGSAISVPSIASFAGGAPAVSGAYIFVPGTDGRLYALLGSQ